MKRNTMRFSELYSLKQPTISFELFPPKTERGMADLTRRLPQLARLEPDFISVTYGAMGSTRDRTLEIVRLLQSFDGLQVAHHLTCVGADSRDLRQLLEQIRDAGIENLVALRGDPPQGQSDFETVEGGFSNAHQLVSLARQVGDFGIAVAGYPEKHIEAADFETDLLHLKHKVDCGADVIITQLFYRNRSFYRFVERCRGMGIQVPIVAGLLPILNREQIQRISGFCGCTIPTSLTRDLMQAGDDAERVREIGIRYTLEQAQELLESGVDGIHFYVLNRSSHITRIMEVLRPGLLVGARGSGD